MKNQHDIKREIYVLRFIWKMAKGEHGKLLSAILINVLSAILPAGIAYLVKLYIDDHALNFTNLLNRESLISFFSLIICGILFGIVSQLIMGYCMPNIKRNVELNCIRKFSKLPHSYIIDSADNRFIMALSIESGMITGLIPMVYRSFIKAPVTIIGFVVLLLFVSPLLTLICFLLIATIIIGVLLFRKSIKQLNKRTYNRIGDLHQYFSEWLGGYKVFITSGAAGFMKKQLSMVSVELAGLSKRLAKIKALQTTIIEMTTILVTIVFLWIASQNVQTGSFLNIGELILFPGAIIYIRGEVLKIIYGYVQLAGTESAAKRIIDIIEYPENKENSTVLFDESIDTLSLKDVTFGYNEKEGKVLDSATITLYRGEVNTIVGRSGTGKTTLLNLFMRLRLPDEGAVLYNDKDIHSLSEDNLLSHIALVEQEPFVFKGTLAENLFFDKRPDTEKVLHLLRQFGLSHLADNEAALFETFIGTGNRQLSTGEKQRIAIVRALIKKADVIFFDEVTSNLDYENAKRIIEYIRLIAKDRLVVCASHDPMLIDSSTRLYEIASGEIKCITKKETTC